MSAPREVVINGKSERSSSQGRERAEGKSLSRRGFLSWLSLGWVALTATLLSAAVATGRFLFPNVLFEPPMTFRAGSAGLIQVGQVDERFKDSQQVWLVRDEGGIYALLAICTHLGCTPNWLQAEQKYKCPCHGSGFYKSGINFEGPAPRPLERVMVSLAEDGQILVDKTQTYQYEKGEWENAGAYLPL